jgi:uncharacterized metal-binding protein YceD (DUF177 family)
VTAPEFPRPFDRRAITNAPVRLVANEAECAALAQRFAIPSVGRLEALLDVFADGEVIHARGRMEADIVQSCAVSGDDLPVTIDEQITLRFVPPRAYDPDAEIELAAEELDEIEYEGGVIDLGEAVAQTLALAIDPYLTGPDAEKVRAEVLAAQEPSGPFAALAKLKKD